LVRSVDIREATTCLSLLIDLAAAGEEIIIAREGRPVARIVALPKKAVKRRPGRMRGRIRIGRDFDDPFPPGLFGG